MKRVVLEEKAIERLEKLNNLISGLEVVEDCGVCGGKGELPLLGPEYNKSTHIYKCTDCQGSRKVSRPATWDDILSETLSTLGIGSGGLILPSGGILKLKKETKP
jgi:hypothetical protein